MGNNFCVCDGDNTNEKESNIFSVIPRANNLPKEEEYKTLSIENKLTQGSNYKTFMDYNTSINNKLDNFLNEIYKTNNDSQKNENKLILETKKDDNNFNCSGKFNILPNCETNNLTNGKINNDSDSINIKDKKEINNNGSTNLKKNDLGFVSFKSLIVDNNNNIQMKENKEKIDNNKDNNMTISLKTDNNDEIENKNNFIKEINYINNNKINEKEENGSPLIERNNIYNQLRYNEISKYSDVSDEDYLNYESNYTNSNKREANRDEHSLFDDDENNAV